MSEGRLEFVGGGWAMHDEASAHYTAIVDNVATGVAQLKRLFGEDEADEGRGGGGKIYPTRVQQFGGFSWQEYLSTPSNQNLMASLLSPTRWVHLG